MRRALMLSPLFALTVLTAGRVFAQTPPPAPRPISPEIAAKLAAIAPKFVPPKPTEEKPAADLREIDKPKNAIIRLPAYVVQDSKIRLPKEREMLTPQGRLDLAYKRHPGLRLGSFGPLNNNVWANALLEEELGIERQKEMFDLMSLEPGSFSKPPIFMGRPPFSMPVAGSGPWRGLVVPWERR